MRRKIRLFLKNNKDKIIKIIGVAVLVYVIILIADNNAKKQNEEKVNENGVVEKVIKQNSTYLPSSNNPTITDRKVSEEEVKKDTEIMENFISKCNENKVEEAYQLLSKDCKEELFPTVQDFYNNYYKDIFTEKKSYDFETWVNYGVVTYKVKIMPDIMSSGKVSEEYIEDYYTVVKEDNEKKLNIHNFIRKQKVDKKAKVESLEVQVLNRYIYEDDETYEITFKNTGDKKITIDTKEKTDTIFLRDTNDVTYEWFGNEIANEQLIIEPGKTKTLRIKINKVYNPSREDEAIVFKDIRIEENEKTLELEIRV